MRATRQIRWAAIALSAGFAALGLAVEPTAAGPTQALKSDKLIVTPTKGDLLNRKPDRAQPLSPPATHAPLPANRGPAARKLIDIAVRDEGMWLNSFATRSMPLDALDCAMLSDEIVSSLPLPASAVQRLAEEELMRQTRVCGVNGSVLVTCYGGAATVSLRPPRPGDGCGG